MKRVVLVCPYNTVGLQIAAALFNRAAEAVGSGGAGRHQSKEHADGGTLQVLREVGVEQAQAASPVGSPARSSSGPTRVIGLRCPLDPELSAAVARRLRTGRCPTRRTGRSKRSARCAT